MPADIFESGAQTLVCPVNCVGVMGAGLALAFKHRFAPALFPDYQRVCENGQLKPGEPWLTRWEISSTPGVLYFPTKDHWRDTSKLADIEAGLAMLAEHYADWWGITSIAIPALGCGLGGLDWADVKPLIESALEPTDMRVELYPPRSPDVS